MSPFHEIITNQSNISNVYVLCNYKLKIRQIGTNIFYQFYIMFGYIICFTENSIQPKYMQKYIKHKIIKYHATHKTFGIWSVSQIYFLTESIYNNFYFFFFTLRSNSCYKWNPLSMHSYPQAHCRRICMFRR